MNNTIADILKGYIDTLAWSDKTAGLVQTANVRVKNGEGAAIDKSYPVSCNVTYNACIKGAYQDLAPDSKKKSVMYFEDRGVSFVEKYGNRMRMRSSLRLVGWMNLCLIDDSCGSTGTYVVDVIRVLPTNPFSSGPFISITISNISQVERSVDIFSKYTYNEQATQYLMYPYDYFALDLDIEFTIPCIEDPYVAPDFDSITADNTVVLVDSDLITVDHT